MTDFIQMAMKKNKIVGLSIALVDDQQTVWAKGFGYQDTRIPGYRKKVASH